jgi:TPR repeat protein
MFGVVSTVSLAALAVPSSAFAETAILSVEAQANFDAALDAYNDGNMETALRLAKIAARAGSADAAVMAGHILRKGETGRIDMNAAREWYERGALKGHPDALVALGEMGLREQGGMTKMQAVSYLNQAADAGRTDAMRVLADLYRTGQGVKADPEQARHWLEKAAQSFDPQGTKELADSLFESDPKAALKAYEQAAAGGNIEAAYIAGVMYAENFNIPPNEQKSSKWLRVAAEGGHAAAMADYGLLVYQGVSVEKSEKEAAAWFQKSAEKGDPEGQFLYAFTLAKGEGVKQNFGDAYYWVLKSLANSDKAADIDIYDKDKLTLKTRLEENVDPAVLAEAKARAQSH